MSVMLVGFSALRSGIVTMEATHLKERKERCKGKGMPMPCAGMNDTTPADTIALAQTGLYC